jgi:hypothetical protein
LSKTAVAGNALFANDPVFLWCAEFVAVHSSNQGWFVSPLNSPKCAAYNFYPLYSLPLIVHN